MQKSLGLADVGPSSGNIANLLGQPFHLCLLAKNRFQASHQIDKRRRPVIAEIKHFISLKRIVHRSDNSADDIVNIGVIPAGRAVAEQLDRLVFDDFGGELMNSQVRSLPWPVYGEKSERHDRQIEAVTVAPADRFAGRFRCPVWRSLLQYRIVLREGDLLV